MSTIQPENATSERVQRTPTVYDVSPLDQPDTAKHLYPVPQLATEEEIAARLKVSKRHLSNLRERRLIPAIKLGRVVRFDPASVAQALANLEIRRRERRAP